MEEMHESEDTKGLFRRLWLSWWVCGRASDLRLWSSALERFAAKLEFFRARCRDDALANECWAFTCSQMPLSHSFATHYTPPYTHRPPCPRLNRLGRAQGWHVCFPSKPLPLASHFMLHQAEARTTAFKLTRTPTTTNHTNHRPTKRLSWTTRTSFSTGAPWARAEALT